MNTFVPTRQGGPDHKAPKFSDPKGVSGLGNGDFGFVTNILLKTTQTQQMGDTRRN